MSEGSGSMVSSKLIDSRKRCDRFQTKRQRNCVAPKRLSKLNFQDCIELYAMTELCLVRIWTLLRLKVYSIHTSTDIAEWHSTSMNSTSTLLSWSLQKCYSVLCTEYLLSDRTSSEERRNFCTSLTLLWCQYRPRARGSKSQNSSLTTNFKTVQYRYCQYGIVLEREGLQQQHTGIQYPYSRPYGISLKV
jgi:hypothetical protein